MIELACREAVFHFNKHHLIDPTTPMWVVKTKGKTYMVNHVTATVPWSTKETPDNNHTKGAIKLKNALLTIDDDNCAVLLALSKNDILRLKAKKWTRILFTGSWKDKMVEFFQEQSIKFTPFKSVSGGCGRTYYICDIKDSNDIALMKLSFDQSAFRILQENEAYYKAYDNDKLRNSLDADEVDYFDLYEDDEDDQ